jgi:hypothetical protein
MFMWYKTRIKWNSSVVSFQVFTVGVAKKTSFLSPYTVQDNLLVMTFRKKVTPVPNVWEFGSGRCWCGRNDGAQLSLATLLQAKFHFSMKPIQCPWNGDSTCFETSEQNYYSTVYILILNYSSLCAWGSPNDHKKRHEVSKAVSRIIVLWL